MRIFQLFLKQALLGMNDENCGIEVLSWPKSTYYYTSWICNKPIKNCHASADDSLLIDLPLPYKSGQRVSLFTPDSYGTMNVQYQNFMMLLSIPSS